MSNRKIGPFTGLEDIGSLQSGAEPDECKKLVTKIKDVLIGEGCCPAGTHSDCVKDKDWERDLTDFVNRSCPHRNTGEDGAKDVSLKLNTLQAIVDNDGEIIAWKYIED
jgi:hypothetical protein